MGENELNTVVPTREQEFNKLIDDIINLPIVTDEAEAYDEMILMLYRDFPDMEINNKMMELLNLFLSYNYSSNTTKFIDEITDFLQLTKTNGYYTDFYNKRVSYDNIRTLKSSHTELKLDLGHVCEIYKCNKSYKYFRSNYCKIITKSGIGRPEPRNYQVLAEDMMLTGDDGLLFFPRQCINENTLVDIQNNNQKSTCSIKDLFDDCKKEYNEII